MTEDRLTPAQVEDRLVTALGDIVEHWDAMLTPPTKRPGATGGGGVLLPDDAEASKARTVLEGQLMAAPDLPRITQVVDVRAAATTTLNGWCRAVIEDHTATLGIPGGYDVPGMCAFLIRWAPRIADDAGPSLVMLEEVQAVASAVHALAEPAGRGALRLGACPLTWQDPSTSDDLPCPGRLTGDEEGWITCSRCGTRAVADWWEARIAGHGDAEPVERTVTASEIVELARSEFGQRIKPDAVWQWVRRNRLSPVDVDTKPHRYPLRDVVVLLMRKAG